MRLALFDLDHTLIPFDSGMAWTRFLIERGALEAGFEAVYLALCEQYVAGTIGIEALHRASVAPLARHPHAVLARWAQEFEMRMAPRLPAGSRAVVARHREAGELCVLVTATTRFIAEPFARLFGIAHVLATEAERIDDRLTGEIDGLPCHREHKLQRVNAWLATAGLHLQAFERSWFYSDSAGDLPLLQAVTHPVAVRPDARLRAHALQHGWPIVDMDVEPSHAAR
jgi:HAD superfamily hydrolase (TIGR01490 family)